jgi:predicted  nucleic acid-binding Zn-ribbon protein
MKNFLIIILVLVIAGLAYANRTLLKSLNFLASHPSSSITVVNAPASSTPQNESVSPTSSPMPKSTSLIPAPERKVSSNLDDEMAYLKNQIKAAGPDAIDQQIKTTQTEITSLNNQLKSYEGAQSAQISATTQMQLQQSMNQHMIDHLNYQIQNLDRQERTLHRNYGFYGGQFDVTTFQPIDPNVQAKLTSYANQIQAFTAQRDQLSAQNLQQASDGSAQLAQSQANLDNARNSVRAQISFLQDEMSRLQDERSSAQDTVKLLQQEYVEMQQHQNPNQAPRQTSPSSSPSPANTAE